MLSAFQIGQHSGAVCVACTPNCKGQKLLKAAREMNSSCNFHRAVLFCVHNDGCMHCCIFFLLFTRCMKVNIFLLCLRCMGFINNNHHCKSNYQYSKCWLEREQHFVFAVMVLIIFGLLCFWEVNESEHMFWLNHFCSHKCNSAKKPQPHPKSQYNCHCQIVCLCLSVGYWRSNRLMW